jgi:hypothetical protein
MARNPDLSFAVDELLFETSNKFPGSLALGAASTLHRAADRGADLGAFKKRLLSALPKIKHGSMQMSVAKALAHHAFRHDDVELLRALLAAKKPWRRYVLRLDYRTRMTDTVVAALEVATRSFDATERDWLYQSLHQQVQWYRGNVLPFLPGLLSALAEKPAGRGHKRVDPAKRASDVVAAMAKKKQVRKTIVEQLQPIAAGKGLAAKNARALLATLE